MARRVAQHGTVSGYKRHLRLSEEPCSECREANRRQRRSDRGVEVMPDTREPRSDQPATEAPEASEADDLRKARDVLVQAIADVRDVDPSRLPSLVRELRGVWQAIRELSVGEGGAEAVVVDEFEAARRARAVRQAGA